MIRSNVRVVSWEVSLVFARTALHCRICILTYKTSLLFRQSFEVQLEPFVAGSAVERWNTAATLPAHVFWWRRAPSEHSRLEQSSPPWNVGSMNHLTSIVQNLQFERNERLESSPGAVLPLRATHPTRAVETEWTKPFGQSEGSTEKSKKEKKAKN